MGTEISLIVGGVTLVWSKNTRGTDHGPLFQEQDRRALRCDQINYAYYAEEGLDPSSMEMALVRKLGDMVDRLELLGFTLQRAESAYADAVITWREEREMIRDEGDPPLVEPLSFDEFVEFACRHPLAQLDDTYIERTPGETNQRSGRFADASSLIARIPTSYNDGNMGYSERSFFGEAINILHPYLMLRILAENPDNAQAVVTWQYGALVENGWASLTEFEAGAKRTQTFLICTEGSSDVHIIKHALALLRPHVTDFFRFIDVSERHPFAGTGNLVKFAEGLAKIDVQNQVVFVFDNDAEGAEAFEKLSALNLPSNMRAIVLPELEVFRSFPAKGPQGEHLADINGRAAAIECYLDHRLRDYPPPSVIWTNYKKETGTYHGALEHKETYMRAFLDQTPESLVKSGYDTLKLEAVLDALISSSIRISEEAGSSTADY